MKESMKNDMMMSTKGMRHTAPVMNPLKNINKPMDGVENILIKDLTLEFEVRRSKLTDFYAHSELSTCICEIKLDSPNILDL